MPEWEAPAKLNFDLRVAGPDRHGMHPLRSLVQTVEWTDLLTVEEGEEDTLVVEGEEISRKGDNLVWRAVTALELASRPRLELRLEKVIPVAAGLGGGSSDAAAMLAAAGDMLGVDGAAQTQAAVRVGADVPYFLTGGTALMEGHGEEITRLSPLAGFAVTVAVPPFPLTTPDVYRRWDELDGPTGPVVTGSGLPPPLRPNDELRNDLIPAAVSLRPELADWMADLERRWSRAVLMSGSGPACFAFFSDLDEAAGAAGEAGENRGVTAADLRPRGVARVS